MWQKAENTKQMPNADGTQRAQASSTDFKSEGSNTCEHTHTHTHSLPPLSHRNTYKSKTGVWDKKKVKPHRTSQGKWPETVKSGWQMAKAEWMADDRGRRQTEGTVQQMATDATRG